MLSEKVEELLQSPILEDVVIGIRLAYNEVGERGLEKIFIFDSDSGWNSCQYKYGNKNNMEGAVVEFDKFDVFIGPICIEYCTKATSKRLNIKEHNKLY